MLNIARIDEITKEIRDIRLDQEDVEQYTKKLQQEEEYAYEYIQNLIFNMSKEFEACQGDRYLTNLVEQRYNGLKETQRECEEYLLKLQEEKRKFRNKCELEIAALEKERNNLMI